MKRRGMLGTMMLIVCLVITGVCVLPGTVSAKQNTEASYIKSLAKKQVKGAKIVKVDKDEEDGQIVYEIEMLKGKKEYDLVYRASDSKLISYGWEKKSQHVEKGKGKLISESKAEKFAKKQVKDADITSIAKKCSSGVDVYKVKMINDTRKYELKLHARTGAVLEYEWDLIEKTVKDDKDSKHSKNNKDNKNKNKDNKNKNKDNKNKDKDNKNKDKDNKNKDDSSKNYISVESAKQIALEEAGGGTVVKAEFDMEDGMPVYEIEIVDGMWEYEIEIHAVTGSILKNEVEHIYD